MRNLLFLAIFFIFVYKISAEGASSFYAEFTLTNKEYGAGAQFPCKVWYDLASKNMRIDYFSPQGTKFMTVYYDYTTKDKYQICGTNCSRATWNTPQPPFQFTPGTSYNGPAAQCVTPDWNGPRTCPGSCATYNAVSPSTQEISSLSYNDATTARLCLVRWKPGPGFTWGPEWHINVYKTTGYLAGEFPTDVQVTYKSVLSGVTCPTPTCFAELDIALSIDESGSIGNNWGTYQTFVKDLIGSLDIKSTGIRVGLSYFSGWGGETSGCGKNGTAGDSCSGGCAVCGGLWNTLTPEVSTNKANLIKLVNDHVHQKGYTCISCGVDQGIRILNAAPKANVRKLIILTTDGVQNRITGALSTQSALAKSMGIDIIAVGVSNSFDINDLKAIATDPSNIYTTDNFGGLQGLISQIITPLCQPLPSIDTCNFCSGLCSCQANCNCPTCNDFDACTSERCDIRPSPLGTGGICVSTNITNLCNDNDVCTQNLCTPSTGCNYTVPTAPPPGTPADRYCKIWRCQNPVGFVEIDRGDSQCPPLTDKCQIRFCNNSADACSTINRNLTAFGVAITYTTSAGQTLSTTGCGRKAGAFQCQEYTCNTNTGVCAEDNSKCRCLKDTDCDDGNGCTVDRCITSNTTANTCVYVQRDCWSELSNGNCISISQVNGSTTNTQTTVGANSSIADSFYANGPDNLPLVNGLPQPASRNCFDLACYKGQRSTYTCQSLSNVTSQCVRSTTNCLSAGCTDNVCQVTGNWNAGQVNTDCGVQKTHTCNDNIACTANNCASTFTGTTCYSNNRCASTNGVTRCTFPTVNSNCNDNDVCTSNVCTTTTNLPSGCVYTSLGSQPNNLCFIRGCNPLTGNFSFVNETACPASPNKCNITYCDPAGAGTCRFIDRNTTSATQTITYTEATGSTFSVTGCYRPPQGATGCIQFKCDSNTGGCIVDSSTCGCTDDSQCQDYNGCTDDRCDTVTTNKCVYTPIDCFAEMSGPNGDPGCTLNGAFNPTGISNATGLNNYNNQGAQDQPFDNNVKKDCHTMGCFGGRRNTYTCTNLTISTHQCVRTPVVCPKTGCTDTVCRTLGTWTGGQIDTDCGALIPINCAGQANKCNVASCNPSSSYGDLTRCTLTSNASLCNDNNVCTLDACDDGNGCVYTNRTDKPADNFCYTHTCDPLLGWIRVDRGPQQCVSDGCTIRFCDSGLFGGAGGCNNKSRTDTALGSTSTFFDSAGNTILVDGCGKPPADQLGCRDYLCNVTSGQCYQNTSTCECLTDSNCEDGSGCTVDKCVLATGKCSRRNIDCWAELSNGQCNSNINANNPIYPPGPPRPTPTVVGADTTIGLAQYYANFSSLGINFNLDAQSLPSPSTGVSRSCAHLACYNGNPSTYTCFSTQETSYTCQRINSTCGRNGCQDNICRVLGGAWTADFQQTSDCGTIFRPNCADKDSCTNDFCNIDWKVGQPPEQRCIHESLNSTGACDDGNFCTFDYCDSNDTSSDPCKHNLYNDRYVRRNLCKNGSRCDSVQCTVNRCIYKSLSCLPANLCVFHKCNTTTNGTCKSFPTGLYKFDKCGVCGGNGLSCIIITPANPNRTSIAVALGVGLGVGLCLAAAIIAFLSKKSFDMYNAIGMEQQGTVTNNPTHQGGEDHIDTSHYN